MKNLILSVDGHEQNIVAEVIEKKLWFKINSQVFAYDLVDLSDKGYSKKKSATKAPDKITAPMPGKITKIFVAENQHVNKGEALLVMEAMKMEYTLKADAEAKLEKLYTEVGQQVSLGQLLIQLKEIKE